MITFTDAPVKLFEGQLPSFEEIKKLSAIVNASERNRIAFRQESEKQSNALLSGLGFFVCCDYAVAAEKLGKGKDCVQKFMTLGFI